MPAYSIGRSSRGKAAKSDTPGPGSYAASSAERTVIPKWSMGTGQRNKLYETGNTPGPGSYIYGSTFTGPRYHFGGKNSQSMRTFSPGPGQYTPNVNSQKRLVTYKFTMPGRGLDRGARTDAPGPGSYTFYGPKKHSGGKFGRDPRGTPILPSGLLVPGPGAYESSKRPISKNSQSPKYT
jgi:hypothetical protein